MSVSEDVEAILKHVVGKTPGYAIQEERGAYVLYASPDLIDEGTRCPDIGLDERSETDWYEIGYFLKYDDHAFFPSEYTKETGGILGREAKIIQAVYEKLEEWDEKLLNELPEGAIIPEVKR